MLGKAALHRCHPVILGCAVWACAPDIDAVVEDAGPLTLELGAVPLVSIGVVDGDERYQLVRVTSAWKQPDGRLVVLDPGRAALLFYDMNGEYLFRTGGRGQGPGEMQRIAIGWPYRGDSIAVYDLTLRRLTIHDADGRYARSFQNPVRYRSRPGIMPSQSCCVIRAPFADGSFVGHPPDDIPVTPGPDRFSAFTPWWVSPDGTETHRIGTFESALFRHDAGSRTGVKGYATSYYFRYVVMGDRLIGGNGFGGSLQSAVVMAHPDGAGITVTRDTVPLPWSGQHFSPELQAAYERALRADYDANRGRYEGDLASHMQPFPETAPAFVNITADADGRIWLERWTPEYGRTGAPLEYELITPAGTHVATVMLPSGSRVLWAGGGQVLLLEQDEFEVQYVRLYELRPAAGGS